MIAFSHALSYALVTSRLHLWMLYPHNVLTNLINGCLPINLMLEKRCIKFIWNFFNSTHELHKTVAINCFYNQGSTLAENIKYLMYKYNILIDDWHRPLS